MPSPICSCITAGFGVKSLRRYRSMPHGLLSPVGHPGYKNDRGERVSSKTGDRSICTVGPPSAKAGGTLPTMRRHNTCQAKKHLPHRTEFATPRPKHIKNSRPIRRSPVSLWLPHTGKKGHQRRWPCCRGRYRRIRRQGIPCRDGALLPPSDVRTRARRPSIRGYPHILFTGGAARRDPTGKALAAIDRDRRRFFFDFQGTTLPSEAFLSGVFPVQSKQPFTDELRIRDVFPPVDLDAPADAVRGRHVGGPGTQALKGFAFTVTAQQQHAGKSGLLGQDLAQHLDQRGAWRRCS